MQDEFQSRHRPRKRFGQHFLHAPGIIESILRAIAPDTGQAMIEIGPGLGAITLPLLQRLGELHAVEIDRELAQTLAERAAACGRLHLHRMDALKIHVCKLFPDRKDVRLVGNLPYNISTPLLFHLIEQAECIRDMHFLLQKEVVDRLAALPGSRRYGRLSVMVQYRCRVEPLFEIGPGAFRPPPRVRSAFVRLTPHAEPPVKVRDEAGFAEIVRKAFEQRRKTLRNALRDLLDERGIRAAGVDPAARAETLGLAEFARLADALPQNRSEQPD